MSFTVASRWCCDHEWILAWRCVQAGTLVKYFKFGAYKVVNISLFTAKRSKWSALRRPHKTKAQQQQQQSFYVRGRTSVHTCPQHIVWWKYISVSVCLGVHLPIGSQKRQLMQLHDLTLGGCFCNTNNPLQDLPTLALIHLTWPLIGYSLTDLSLHSHPSLYKQTLHSLNVEL